MHFDSRRNLLKRQLKPVCEKQGLKGVTWHWLRHANPTLLDAVGTRLGTVQALLGHEREVGNPGEVLSPACSCMTGKPEVIRTDCQFLVRRPSSIGLGVNESQSPPLSCYDNNS